MIRVVIADDESLFRSGLSLIVDSEPDLEVVAEASDGLMAVELVLAHRPDVVLMDIQMPGSDGIAATKEILALGGATRVVILTTFGLDQYVYDALQAGASGFVLKTVPAGQLVDGIRAVAAGDALLAPTITRRLIEEWVSMPRPGQDDSRLSALTDREREVFTMVGCGLSNAEIAQRLFLGEATVKTHIGRLFAKLRVRDRVQAVVLAYETGVVRPGRD